ncbi:MAG: hypothetical protein FWC41_13930 [Firmicutes bacterium]|nr:hypothetical protein [Bacillota bacterium]
MKKINYFIALTTLAVLFSACSQSTSSVKRLPANEILGNLPGIEAYYHVKDSLFKAEYKDKYAAFENKKSISQSDIKKMTQISEKEEQQKKELRDERKKEYTEEAQKLIGKIIPVKNESQKFEVIDLKISKTSENGLTLKGKVKFLQDINSYNKILSYVPIDKNGKAIDAVGTHYLQANKKVSAGELIDYEFYFPVGKKYLNFAAIRFFEQ